MDVNLVIWEESSSGGGTRTPDKVVNSHLLYQLSYSGKIICQKKLGNLGLLLNWSKVQFPGRTAESRFKSLAPRM